MPFCPASTGTWRVPALGPVVVGLCLVFATGGPAGGQAVPTAPAQADSARAATERAIALRDTINRPRPLRPDEVRANRREHLLAATGVAVLASFTFLLYNLRTR